ncbi:MAG: hypothetical protein F6K40_14530 [Okeania sp. SIO3I5]|uniref:hypothetical protein n=1 Tax=Okeania sp. SIO3I5 TaxID=2607805 RepID=UPI0013B8CDFF|nr:hypothetical protein [Okeania sp. SIO3I5]NEQ37414.1 hypothetical protein [Okeania sp. SIO3I5]
MKSRALRQQTAVLLVQSFTNCCRRYETPLPTVELYYSKQLKRGDRYPSPQKFSSFSFLLLPFP